MKTLVDINGNPTSNGFALWEVIKNDSYTENGNYIKNTTLIFEGTEDECRKFENGIVKTNGYYLNARPFYKKTNANSIKL